MPFDFPASPSEGQIFNAPGGPSYVFNTPVWKAVGQGQIAIISDTPPPSPANGALWYESDSGVLYIWYNDGNSSQWVQVGGIQAGAPPPPAADNAEYVMVNGAWRLKSQSFDMTGTQIQSVAVPSWRPKQARLSGYAYTANAVVMALTLRVSVDGTTYFSGASDYTRAGLSHATGATSPGVGISTATASNAWLFTVNGDNGNLAHVFNADVALERPDSTVSCFTYSSYGASFSNSAAVQYSKIWLHGFTALGMTSSLTLGGLQVGATANIIKGKLTVEWLP